MLIADALDALLDTAATAVAGVVTLVATPVAATIAYNICKKLAPERATALTVAIGCGVFAVGALVTINLGSESAKGLGNLSTPPPENVAATVTISNAGNIVARASGPLTRYKTPDGGALEGVVPDRAGGAWFGTDAALWHVSVAGALTRYDFPKEQSGATVFGIDKAGNPLLEQAGYAEYGNVIRVTLAGDLALVRVNEIGATVLSEGTIWLANGISDFTRLPEDLSTPPQQLPSTEENVDLMAVAPGSHNVYYASLKPGVGWYDVATQTHHLALPSRFVRSMAAGPDGKLWLIDALQIDYAAPRAVEWTDATWTTHAIAPAAGTRPRAIVVTPNGSVYYAAESGLFRMTNDRFTSIAALATDDVRFPVAASDNSLWYVSGKSEFVHYRP